MNRLNKFPSLLLLIPFLCLADGAIEEGHETAHRSERENSMDSVPRSTTELTLTVFSEYGNPTHAGTETVDSGETPIQCEVEIVAPNPFSSDIRHFCTGWKGTGSVPATGTGTNCTFVLTEDSTLEWIWNTNVWISLAVDGDGTSAFRHGWFDSPDPAMVPFDAPAGLLRCTLSGDADGVTVDHVARTVSIPTDRPRAVSLHVESLCQSVGTDGKFVDYAFGGDAPWIPLADASLSDGRCLRSGVVGAGETSVLETSVSGAGQISFRWKTSCNRGDYCKFVVDGTEIASISRSATEWATVDWELGEGTHVLRWSWEKSASAVLGENGAFLDDVRWRPYVDLTVVSADGTPSPATGTTRCLYGDIVEASVAELAAGARTRRVCTGWTGTGSVSASGTELATTFAITNDSSLVWNWRTEHWIDIQTGGLAKTDFTARWMPEGSVATAEVVTLVPGAEMTVLGDSEGAMFDGTTLTLPVDGPRTVTIRATAPNLSLDVASDHGEAVPAPGRTWCDWGTEVDASVAGPAPSNGVQFVCTGWTGTGSVPASGTGTNVAFTIGEASSLTWNWQTNVWLSLSCTGRVAASLSGEWVEKGTTKRIEYVPLTEFHDLKLTGDADGVVWNREARTLDVPADRPRDLALSLTMLTLRTALDAESFSWTTSGTADWIPQVETSADGVDAARSGGIATGEESHLSTTVSGAGTLSWSWMLDADGVLGVDVELDGAYALSLETPGSWQTASLAVQGEGDHVVAFIFWNEDPDATNRTEGAFLDRVSWTGASPSGAATKNTPAAVSHSWLTAHAPAILAEVGGDYEAAAAAIAKNARPVWECFVAGLEPEDPTSDFRVVIAISNGVSVLTFEPFLGSERVYLIEGKETLDGEWGPTNAMSRFFRGKASLPDGWAPDGNVDGFPEVVTITFDANGGTVSPSMLSFTQTGNGVLGEVPTPVGTSVLFDGWFTDRAGGVRFDQWSPLPWTDLSLFARWNVSLVFDPNGGEGAMPGIVATSGQSVTLPESVFSKVGHSFGGWAATASSEASWQPGESVAFDTSRTLFADWDVDRHSIAFDSAGGSTVPPLKLDYGAMVAAPAPPVRDGYAFTGWIPPLPETMPASNLVATATWRLTPATLSFDTVDGTEIPSIVQNVGTPVVRPADPTRTGYAFAGWSPAFPATMPGSDTTLVAQWTPNRYLVRFRRNGGTGGMLDLECVYNRPAAIPLCTFVDGDIPFLGWATSPDGPVEFANGETVLNLATNDGALVSLYAQWSPGSYRIHFDPNGGTGEMPDMVFWVDLPADLAANAFMKTNRFFSGWSTNGTDVAHLADEAEVVNLVGIGETAALRAIWSETESGLALKYHDNGYSNYSSWTDSEIAMIEDFASRSFALETTTLDWGEALDTGMTSADSNMELRYRNGGLSTEGLQLNSATNRFHGKYANNSQNYFSVVGAGLLWIDESGLYEFGATSDDGFVLYVDGTRVTQSNCSVGKGSLDLSAGWHRIAFGYAELYNGQGLSVQWKKPGDASFSPIPQSVLFHRTGTDAVSFHPNGGTGEMADIAVDRNFGTKLPQLAFEKIGHSFDGWATNETEAGVFSNSSGIPPGVSDLYATWRVNRYSIQFDSNGGSSVSTITQDYGTPVTAPADPTRTGYTFDGWSPTIPGTIPASNVTCIAQWTPNRHTIRFDANGGTGEMADLECAYDEVSPGFGGLSVRYYDISSSGYSTWTQSESAMTNYFAGRTPTIVANTADWGESLQSGFQGNVSSYFQDYPGLWLDNVSTNRYHGKYANSSQDYFSMLFEGDLLVSQAGTYSFAVSCDNAIVLYIDGTKVLSFQWPTSNGQPRSATSSLTLAPGKHRISIATYESTGGQGMFVEWKQPGKTEWSPLPQSVLCSGIPIPGTILPEVAFSGPNGAAFLGWSTTSDGLVEFANEERVSNLSSVDGDVTTFYAKWYRGSFTVHFDANGGTGEMPDQVFTLDVPQKLAENAFSKPNRFFAGWATNEMHEVVYADGMDFENEGLAGETIMLRATWSETAPGLALRYHDNGYSNYSIWTGSESELLWDFARRSFSLGTTTLGWGETLDAGMTSADSSMESRYRNGGLSTQGLQLNSTTNRFHGKYANTSQNYFSLVGAGLLRTDVSGLYEFGVMSDDGFVLYVDGTRIVESDRSVETRSMNLSAGWHRIAFGYAENNGGQGLSVQWKKPGDVSFVPIPQSVLFHRKGTDSVAFCSNGGTGEMADIDVDRNFGAELPACTFTKSGHSFDGWATNETGTAVFAETSGIPPGVTDLYATWRINQYCIRFDPNGGNAVRSITQDYGTDVTPPEDPTRKGYIFEEWSPAVPATMPPSNVVCTAQWTKTHSTISFDAAGGSAVPSLFLSIGSTIVPPANPARPGYTFTGWSPAIPATMPMDDMSCTAQWTPNRYTIRFDANGGTGEMADLECIYDDTASLPACTFSGPNGAAFLGWSTTADGLVEFADTERVSNLSSVDGDVVTLYAKWNRGSFAVHFDANGGTGEMPNQVFTLDVPQKLTSFSFSKEGFYFAGWSDTPDGPVLFDNCETVSNLAGEGCLFGLHAIWAENIWSYQLRNGGLVITGVSGNCPTNIVIPSSIDGIPVTSIGENAFYDCSELMSITIPDSVTSIGDWAFWGCFGLTSITIPDSVTSIEGCAFEGCSGLTSITIPDSVTRIENSAFYDCSGLTNAVIGSGVTSIGAWAFRRCSGLTSITIPDSVTIIGSGAFDACSRLTSTMIPDSVTSIGDYAFSACSGLMSITIPNSVTSIGDDPFYGCSGLTTIIVDEDNPVYDSRDNSNAIIRQSDNTLIVGCCNTTIPDNVTSIGYHAFSGCSGLTSITIPDSVTSIGYGAFFGCSGLCRIVVSEDNPVFDSRNNCNAIIRMTDNVLVAGCKRTQIPDSVTRIGSGAFFGCSGLTSITIPDGVTCIEDFVFGECSGLASITISDSVTSIEGCAFEGCSGLTSITIPDSVTSIGDGAFNSCPLTSLSLPGRFRGNTGGMGIPKGCRVTFRE